jgi:hypothetical protein
MELVNLYGTIPVVYKRTTYNIPIRIWLQKQYPIIPPFCYVVPRQPFLQLRTKPRERVRLGGLLLNRPARPARQRNPR